VPFLGKGGLWEKRTREKKVRYGEEVVWEPEIANR